MKSWFPPMWIPYEGGNLSELVYNHSERAYRLAPASFFGVYPLGQSQVYAGFLHGDLIFQVGPRGKSREFFGQSAVLCNQGLGVQRNNRKALRRYARIDIEGINDASLAWVHSEHKCAFEQIPRYLAAAFGIGEVELTRSEHVKLEERVEGASQKIRVLEGGKHEGSLIKQLA